MWIERTRIFFFQHELVICDNLRNLYNKFCGTYGGTDCIYMPAQNNIREQMQISFIGTDFNGKNMQITYKSFNLHVNGYV